MALSSFFADTYALVEYLRGNEGYAGFIEGEGWSTSILNLIELYYAVLRDNDESSADEAYSAFRRRAVEVTDADVREAMKLRLRLKARRLDLSYADAIGYAIARRRGDDFLTGDRVFTGLEGVKLVR